MYRHLKRTSSLLVYFVLVVITPCQASLKRINDVQKQYSVPRGWFAAADFDCILSDPNAKVQLYLNGKHLVTDGVKVAEVGQIFTVFNITTAESGDYVCKAPLQNGLKKSFSVGAIRVLSVPGLNLKFSVSPKINAALEGEGATFTCRATTSKFARVSWYKDQRELTNQNRSKNGDEYTSVLIMSDLDKGDSGVYQCRVTVNIHRFISLDNTGYFPTGAELVVQPFEFITRHQTVFVGDIGSSLTISCNNTDPSASTSLWVQRSHHSVQQVRPDGVKVIQDGSKFVIHSVTIQDGGRYTCKAVSTYGKTISMDMGRFIVLQGGYRDPKAYISPHTKNLNLDKTFNFTCQAFGDSINFTWFKDGSVVPQDMVTVLPGRHYKGYTMFESILTIRNAERSDEGRYTCQITSALQPGYSHSVTANLTIYECPKANGKFADPFNKTVYIECVNGKGTRIECPFPGQYWEDSVKGCVFPPTTPTTPILTWISNGGLVDHFAPFEGSFVFDCRLTDKAIPVQLRKDGRPVTVDGTKVKLVGQNFTISKLHNGDTAVYTCHATGVGIPKKIRVTVTPDLTLDLSVYVEGGNTRFELETSFNKTIECNSYHWGNISWYKLDPRSHKRTLVSKGLPAVRLKDNSMITRAFLNLFDVKQKDSGTYECYKKNSIGAEANTTIEILVKAPVKPKASTSLFKTTKEGNPSQFKVVISGSPFPAVTWYKGQQALVTCHGGQSFKCQSKHKNYTIDDAIDILNRDLRTVVIFKLINPLYPADNGEQRIKVQNLVGEDQATFNVSVLVRPEIKKKNNDVVTKVISKNSPYSLVCDVPRAVPPPEFSWQYQVLSCTGSKRCKSNPAKWGSIPESVAKVKKVTSLRSRLDVRPTDKSIFYRCAVSNDAGADKKDFALHRTNTFSKELAIEGEKIKYKDEHENITMTCRALKSFVGHPTWRDQDDRLITNTSRVRVTFKETSVEYLTHLEIFDAQVNDSGIYACEAANDKKDKDNTSTIVRVLAVSSPSLLMGNITANETNHVSLNCTVSGHPLPAVTWFRAGKLLETKALSSLSECSSRLNDFYLHVYPSELGKPRTHSLVICNARYENSGWYTCEARNSIGEDDVKAYLDVQAPPTVTIKKEMLPESVKSRRLILIRCHATGNPTPHVRWLKQNENGIFVTLGNISIWKMRISTLSISELRTEHHGTYRCVAANALGQKHQDYDLNPPVVQKFKRQGPGAVTKPALIAIVVSGSLVILLLLVIIAVLYRRKKLYGGFYILTLPPMPDYIKRLDPNRTLQEQTHKLPLSADWEFPRNRLTLGKVIGSGAFGQVFVADAVGIVAFDPRSSMRGKSGRRRSRFGSTKSPYYNNKQVTTVACKGLKEDATESEYKDLVSELKILMHIGEHKNIVNLLGACTKGRECDLLVIIEFCPHGNLLEFLRKRRDLFEAEWAPATEKADERFSTTDLVITSFQVARAMEFLASRRCVHRDLAARNVLVGENYVMKVADFGLARDIYKDEHYVKTTAGLLPVKWMAIEALVDRIYTHQSDVWSFGVLLWEIFTLGGSPYPGLPANEVYQYLMEGQRMEQPHDCPEEIYALMLACWEHDPSRRPAFSAIVQAIDKLLEERTTQTGEEYLELENEQDVTENQPYYLEPEEMHPLSSPVFDSPQGSPLPPIPAEEIELECLIKNKDEGDYLNKNEFVFSDNSKKRARNGGHPGELEKERADSMERMNHTKSESSGNISDEDEFISEKEHLMKSYDSEEDNEKDSGVFETPTPYINTRPYTNVNNFVKNYGNDGATSKKEDDFRSRQQSARYV